MNTPLRARVNSHDIRIYYVMLLPLLLVLQACTQAGSAAQQPFPVTPARVSTSQDRSLENLVAFSRLLGYVRHFHPSDQAANTDWEDFAARGMLAVEDAQDADELIQRLQTLFQPIAPTLRVFQMGTHPATPDDVQRPPIAEGIDVIFWFHSGFGGGDQKIMPYESQRIRIHPGERWRARPAPEPNSPFFADLGGGVSALIPLALYADSQGTLPHVDQPVRVRSAATDDSRARHLATVALAWNVFEHFYPYFDVVPVDWMQVLRESLSTARTDNEATFSQTLKRMVAQLQDGHGAVGIGSSQNPPWEWVEGQLILTLVKPSGQLHPGDTVLKINGQLPADLIAEEERFVSSSTPQFRRDRAVRALWTHATDDPMTLQVQSRISEITQVTLSRGEICCVKPVQLDPITEVRPGILYIDLTRINMGDFDDALPRMEQATGLIFDVRGYPGRINASTIGHFIDRPVSWELFYYPLITYPDHKNMDFKMGTSTVEPQAPRLKAKVAFVTNATALSYAESYLAFVEQYRFGEIVGEPTAGETGGHNPFTLFGSYTFDWTGSKVLKQDGSPHHGVGILPSVPVPRTIQGVAEGRDELLERAIRVVTGP